MGFKRDVRGKFNVIGIKIAPQPQYIMLRFLAVMLLALIITLSAAGVAYAQTPTLDEAIAILNAAADALEAGDTAEARQLLTALRAVTLPDGATMSLAEGAWDAVLAQPTDIAAPALRDFAARLAEPPTTLPTDSRARLETVLARPEFQDAQPSLWERFLQWLQDNLPSATPDLQRFFDFIIGLVGVLIVGGLLIFVVRMLRRNMIRGEEPLGALGEIPLHAGEAQAKAGDAATAGNFREAMRLLYLAALLHLDEVGLLRFDRTLTNREVLATVTAQAPLHGALAPVVSQFDRVWYGHAPFGAPDFEQMKAQIDRLRAMKGATR